MHEPPDPELVAAVSARATARHAHHEAGHVVAAVYKDGTLQDVFLGKVDWSTDDDSAETPGATVHQTRFENQPFVTFAGPWAEAMWTVEHDDDVDDFGEALGYAWENNIDGDNAKYESRVEMLNGVAAVFGLTPVGRAWESGWTYELKPLWRPVICQVAKLLIDGQPVTHEIVRSLLDDLTDDWA